MKYYVVWSGKEPGIYQTWDECKAQTIGVAGARFQSFPTREAAEQALAEGAPQIPRPGRKKLGTETQPANLPDNRTDTVLHLPLEVTAEAWAVDAACSGNPGKMEYRGVDLKTGAEVFHFGPVLGTNNIGEFLAIVHALAELTRQGRMLTVYSDSRNALLWIAKKKCNTKLEHNVKTETIHQLISRAETWLNNNKYSIPVKKWHTSKWGEIPADFGRK